MVTVTLVGADGSGKTTLARRLVTQLGVPAKYIYMGVNGEASNIMLPTTWLWRCLWRQQGGSSDKGSPRDPER